MYGVRQLCRELNRYLHRGQLWRPHGESLQDACRGRRNSPYVMFYARAPPPPVNGFPGRGAAGADKLVICAGIDLPGLAVTGCCNHLGIFNAAVRFVLYSCCSSTPPNEELSAGCHLITPSLPKHQIYIYFITTCTSHLDYPGTLKGKSGPLHPDQGTPVVDLLQCDEMARRGPIGCVP